jgi:predicted nucleic acid-binding Zn ribbon protein
MPDIQTLVCPQCRTQFEFIPTNYRRKYCSNKCKRRANQSSEHAPSRQRYLASPKGQMTKKRKADKYYKSAKYKARIKSLDYRERMNEYARERSRRIKQNKQPRPCAICEDPIPPGRKKFCSDLCIEFDNRIRRPAKIHIVRRCPGCKQPKQFSGTYCSNDCYRQSDHGRLIMRQARHRRRARMHNAQVEEVDPLVIAKRDKYKCHICRKRVNMDLDVQDIYSPTMDHLIPISVGGDHTYANIRLAHRICNSRKGNRAVNEQLLLFG